MSKCMTIDETIDQKDTFSEVTPKNIVDSVLEEVLISVLTVSDKGCNRIGDFNINEDFCQQYNQPLHVKDFEQTNINQTTSAARLHAGRNKDRCGNGNETPGGKAEEKVKLVGECKVISEEILADNELQIQNGQIRLERIKSSLDSVREEYYQREDVIKDEKIEIEYYTQGKMNKIYVPLNEPSKEGNAQEYNDVKTEDENKKKMERKNSRNENESPFKPFTTEDLRQVWGNGNSSLVGKWDGDMAGQREEVVKLMEGLSNMQVFPDGPVDPNRPRTCSVAEEDVKKMIKEIEEISFIQGQDVEDYPPDGQGDADLESKSFTKSREMNKSKTESRLFADNIAEDLKQPQEEQLCSSDMKGGSLSGDVPFIHRDSSADSLLKSNETFPSPKSDLCQSNKSITLESEFGQGISSEEEIPKSNQPTSLDDTSATEKLSNAETFVLDVHPSFAQYVEGVKRNVECPAAGSFNLLKSQEKIFAGRREMISRSISGNDIFGEFMVISDKCAAELITEEDIGQTDDSSTLSKPLLEESKEAESKHSLSPNDIESYSAEAAKTATENDNPGNEQTGEKQPSVYNLTDVLSQGSTISQSQKPNEGSATQLEETGSLQRQESVTSSENHSYERDLEKSESGKFRLHSEKMYSRMGYDPAGFQKKKSAPSESEEALIESIESVLQVIEPQDSGRDDESGSISFSLLSQAGAKSYEESTLYDDETKAELDVEVDLNADNDKLSSEEIPQKRVSSGMTTIGPIKNIDYDPKDLSAPDIDFGKMTRITSSRQLSKDLSLLGADMTSTTAVKILEEDDSDESITTSDNECLETSSLVNRDIASLTKVQKIREVMSYQPKPEEDFEDEEALPKPRLDLKDVESLTDERYKVPEVNIPLLSFEVMSDTVGTSAETEKQLIESMGLIISGLTEPYYGDVEESNADNENNTEIAVENPEKEETQNEENALDELEKVRIEEMLDVSLESHERTNESESKYATLSNVIKKASSMFMKKDSDILLRNSKSLPRDASKIMTTDSIRSILDDCSTSASNVLKKSRSMLRNTQSLFKTISQSRMNTESGLESHKMSPSESDVSTVERKLSFLKKEDFTKAKNLIKSKVEKTFKKQESATDLGREKAEVSEEKKNLQVALRNEEKLRVDRMENFKRWLPKTPMVYKSQFVKSQIKIKGKLSETDVSGKGEDNVSAGSESITAVFENETMNDDTVTVEEIAHEVEETPEQEPDEKGQEVTVEVALNMLQEDLHPEYIIMETIHGLPTSDLESPSSEKENVETNVASQDNERGTEQQVSKVEEQTVKEGELDIVPYHTEKEEDKMASKIPSERKMATKKKKFSARLRNFWCSAFGRVKTPPKKSDVS